MKNNIEGVLIYCNKKKPYLVYADDYIAGYYIDHRYTFLNGYSKQDAYSTFDILNGKIVASCEINKWEKIQLERKKHSRNYEFNFSEELLNKACLTFVELFNYIGFDEAYILHLENVQPFNDPPIELSELYSDLDKCKVTKAPQSFRYVYWKGKKYILYSIDSQHVRDILNLDKTVDIRKTLPKELR